MPPELGYGNFGLRARLASALPNSRRFTGFGAPDRFSPLPEPEPPRERPARRRPFEEDTLGVIEGLEGGQGAFGGRRLRRALANIQARSSVQAYRQLWDTIRQLTGQANAGDDPNRVARFLAPRQEALQDHLAVARGNLARDMAARGLTDSSFSAGAMGELAARGAQAGARFNVEALDREEDQRLGAQAALRQILAALATGDASQVHGVVNNAIQEQLQREALEPDFMGQILGMLGSVGGAYLGRPTFRR